MGTEMPASWYDERFPDSKSYRGPSVESPFHSVWMATMVEVIRMSREGGVLVDLGCGPGQLSEYAPSCFHYRGYDFSAAALRMARERSPGIKVSLWNATKDPVPKGDIYVATEFLEHIRDDMRVLHGIPFGKPVIASLPMKDSAGHVRHFRTAAGIRKRYGQALHIQRVISLLPVNSFIVVGTRSSVQPYSQTRRASP